MEKEATELPLVLCKDRVKSSLQLHYTIPLKIYVTELLMKEMK